MTIENNGLSERDPGHPHSREGSHELGECNQIAISDSLTNYADAAGSNAPRFPREVLQVKSASMVEVTPPGPDESRICPRIERQWFVAHLIDVIVGPTGLHNSHK
jgi:hypothetical protein